jgi:hypothetical protein
MKNKKIFIVMGPFRSGTSLVSRILQQFDISAGPEDELYEATDWNPAGYIQRPDVTLFNTSMIRQAGGNLTEPPHPEVIASAIDREFFSSLNLSWIENYASVVIKDPRFCFTLLAWIRHSIFADSEVHLIRVSRDIETTAMSALVHYDVKHYCGNHPDTARQVIRSYDAFAAWHLENLDLPHFHLVYESLFETPEKTIRKIAHFIGKEDEPTISAALAELNEGRSKIDRFSPAGNEEMSTQG